MRLFQVSSLVERFWIYAAYALLQMRVRLTVRERIEERDMVNTTACLQT